jgi:hypothetical protein
MFSNMEIAPNNGLQLTRFARRVQWFLAVVSPSVFYHAWPVTARN